MGGRAGGGAGFGSRGGGVSDAAVEKLAASRQRFGLDDLNASIEPKLLSGEWIMSYSSFTSDRKTEIISVKNSKIDKELGDVVSAFPAEPYSKSTKVKTAYLKKYNEWVSKSGAAYDKAIASYKAEIGKTKNKAAKVFFAKEIMNMQEYKAGLAKDAAWTNRVYSR